MITIEHEGSLTVVGVFGRFEVADFRRLEHEVQGRILALRQIDLLVDLRDMLGYTLDVALEDFKFTREHARDVGRIAVISEEDAVTWVALLSELFMKSEIRVFDGENQAREWLQAAGKQE
jgi:hypothetical protein